MGNRLKRIATTSLGNGAASSVNTGSCWENCSTVEHKLTSYQITLPTQLHMQNVRYKNWQ